MEKKRIALRPLEDADTALLAEWLKKPHVRRWYHHPEDWMAEVQGRQGEYRWLHHFIVMEAGRPIGFCQYYDGYDAREIDDWYKAPCPGHTYSIDYLIGEEDRLGRGLGKEIVAALTEAVQRQGAAQVVVQPEVENHASCHVLLANGYLYDEERAYYYKTLP